jgi:HD-GYP domain-containing protein (c-di-GMP phosphodiesterase class II)
MPVHIVADSVSKLSHLRATLEQRYAVTSELLGGASSQRGDPDAVVVTADLSVLENIATLREMFGKITHARKRIFVIDQKARLLIVQAYALGATRVLISPVNEAKLLAELADRDHREVASTTALQGARRAATVGVAAIASMFSAVVTGQAIDVSGTNHAGSTIADSIAEDGLCSWLDAVRRHHEGTYQHCLLVTGIAVDFGLSLGLGKRDIERLYSAAMFHDIGKAQIPLSILDKPGCLDPGERALTRTHPAAGYEVLKGNPAVCAEILDAVLHHHEYLDGSGYPDALCAASIPDIVRILTISDIFSALIEQRSYKATMPREQAYERIRSMRGRLEAPLVAAFRDVALNR